MGRQIYIIQILVRTSWTGTDEHGIAMSPFQEGGSFFRALGDNGRCVISKEDFYAVRFENAVDVG